MSNPDVDGKVTTTTTTRDVAPRRIWFRVEQVEISWLPVGEAAFLLWVLVVLLGVWLGIGWTLGLI
jgi:hypothetical protein